jgi:D-alanine-D-alanine ligase
MIILFGGSSYEHEISIVSAITIKDKLKGMSLKFVFLDRDREFYLIEKENMKSNYFSTLKYKEGKKLEIIQNGFRYKKLFGYETIGGEVVLNLIHGRDGEDGKIASLLQFFNIKMIGPSIESSVISYNKFFTKSYARELGVSVLDYLLVRSGEEYQPKKFPVIIKPVHLGSSIGVTIANNIDEFQYGLDVAFEFDDEVIVEEFIEGVEEYNLAGTFVEGEWVFSKVEAVKKEKFLSYEDKYLDFSRSEIEEQSVDKKLETMLKEQFKKIYNHYFKGALIRCDFFKIEDSVYLNEINPIPGSLANYLFKNFEEVIKKLEKEAKLEKRIEIDYQYINKIKSAKGGKS